MFKSVKEDLTDRLGFRHPGIQVEPTFIEKAQGESYNGMRRHLPGEAVAPVLNIEPFYEQVSTTMPLFYGC